MKRDIDLREISDGKRYGLNDMVKADCNDCQGCSDCCHGMGESIVLDPMDVFWLGCATGKHAAQLLERELELNVVDGIVLPNLRLKGKEEACPFLNEEGRCSIHDFRPGICRLFPLGRVYEDGEVRYFLQVHECAKVSRTKVKVKKWIDVPDSKRYQQFIVDWHYFLNGLEEEMNRRQDDEFEKQCNMYLLQQFYLRPYNRMQDFYEQFYARLEEAKHAAGK